MMKKNIKWLKEEIWKQDIVMDKGYIYTSDLIYLIDSLDEPEVLSQEWIDEHKVWRINNLRKMTTSDVVPVDKLKDLLVPKQGELETKIQELIESYKQEEGAYSNPENGWIGGFIEDLKNLVEKEQKYYVNLGMAAYVAKWNVNDEVDIHTDAVAISDDYEFYLTEKEIKNYDERFWSFAEPVEEDNND